MSSKGSEASGPHPSHWQIQSRSSTLTLSRQICLHWFPQFTSSIPAQRQPPLLSLMGPVGKHQENTIIRGFPSLPFPVGFHPGNDGKALGESLGEQHKELGVWRG